MFFFCFFFCFFFVHVIIASGNSLLALFYIQKPVNIVFQILICWFWDGIRGHWIGFGADPKGTEQLVPVLTFLLPPFLYSPPSPLPLFPSLSPSSIPSLSPSSNPLPLPFLYSPPFSLPFSTPPSLSFPPPIPVCKYYAHQKCQDNAFDDCKHCATYHSGASVSPRPPASLSFYLSLLC